MSVRARITFNNDTPDMELPSLIEIKLKNGDVVFKFYGHDGPRNAKHSVEDIAYIQLASK